MWVILTVIATQNCPNVKSVNGFGEMKVIQMAENELLPCPFCGGKAEVILTGNSIAGYSKVDVRCHYCGMGRTYRKIKGMSSDTIRGQVAKKWNRRVNDGSE